MSLPTRGARPFRLLTLCLCLISGAGVGAGASAQEQAYPSRPIRIVVPFPPGGSTDALARILGVELAQRLGRPVVVDNRGGAGGNIGTAAVANATPDGHTLLLVSGNFVVNPSVYASVPYDPVKTFAPITYIASVPSLLLVNASMPARTLPELIALVKQSPGKMNFASTGIGSFQHLTAELLVREGGLNMTHVPFNGAPPAVTALLGGQVHMLVVTPPSVLGHIRAGTLRALAVTSAKRNAIAPDVPTFAESGFPGFEADMMQGLLAPSGTPKPIVARLNKEAVAIIHRPDITQKLLDLGFIPVASSPEEFAKVINVELNKWSTVVKAAGIRAE
jgi:tripartite-type tricarboxylate transporter receptor subunit TctC